MSMASSTGSATRSLSQAQLRELLGRWESRGATTLAPLSVSQQDSVYALTPRTQQLANLDTSMAQLPSSPSVATATREDGVSATPQTPSLPEDQDEAERDARELQQPDAIENSQQFLEWFQKVEAHMERDQEHSHRMYGELLREYRSQCQLTVDEIDKAVAHLESLTSLHESASTKTNILHDACQKLLQDQTSLVQYGETLTRRLNYFTEHEKLHAKLNSPTLSVLSEQFIPQLTRIDECLEFLQKHTRYKDAHTYTTRFQQLQSKALGLVRAHITNTLKTATQNVMTQTQGVTPASTSAHGAAESGSSGGSASFTLFYGKFRMHAPRIRALMGELEARKANGPDYQTLLDHCYGCYFQQRSALIRPSLQTVMSALVAQHANDLPTLMREGCAHMVRVCVNEYQLYQHFFSTVHEGLDELLDHLTRVLYDEVRPLILRRNVKLDTLVELCAVLNVEVLEDKGQEVAAFANVAAEMLGDVQERVALRADNYLDRHIRGFVPSDKDLDYPNKLEALHSGHASFSQKSLEDGSRRASGEVAPHQPAANGVEAAYAAWYPPLARALTLLSKLYQALDRRVYEGFAQEIIVAVLEALAEAVPRLRTRKGELHSQLFLIKHLLALREQISPFEGDFAMRQVEIDFNTLRAAASGLLAQGAALLRLDLSGVLSLGGATGSQGVVATSEVDVRKQVDDSLRAVCQTYIQATAKELGKPLASFLVQVDALPPARRETLGKEGFAAPAKLSQRLAEQDALLAERLPELRHHLQLYLGGTGGETERTLFRPIQGAIMDLYKRVISVAGKYYTAEERASITKLPSPAALESIVDLQRQSPTSSRAASPGPPMLTKPAIPAAVRPAARVPTLDKPASQLAEEEAEEEAAVGGATRDEPSPAANGSSGATQNGAGTAQSGPAVPHNGDS